MSNINIRNLMETSSVSDIPQVSSTGKYSLNVVNSANNGKRVTLSKSLVSKLELDGSFDVIPLKSSGILIMAKELAHARKSTIRLNSKDKRTAYNAGLVVMLAETFNLDYNNGRVSLSFGDIEFDELDGVTAAMVRMDKKKSPDSMTAGTGDSIA